MDIVNKSVINALIGNSASERAAALALIQGNNAKATDTTPKTASSNTDVATISKAAYALNEKEIQAVDPVKSAEEEKAKEATKNEQANSNAKNKTSPTQLSEADLKQVQDLKKRDTEVRRHEAAHLATAGKYATGGASYEFKRGPDGKNYAAGGEVGIDTSPVAGDPQATLQKAQQIRSAAQAPANPSSQDRQVAASATQMETQARQEIAGLTLNKDTPSNQTNEADAATSEGATDPIKSGVLSNATNDSNSVVGSATNNTENNSIEINSRKTTPNKTEASATSAYQAIGKMTNNQNEISASISLVA